MFSFDNYCFETYQLLGFSLHHLYILKNNIANQDVISSVKNSGILRLHNYFYKTFILISE